MPGYTLVGGSMGTICFQDAACMSAFSAPGTGCSSTPRAALKQPWFEHECDSHFTNVATQGFHVVLSDMCHSTMGSSAADVLRSLDLATCAAELAVGPLDPQVEQLPPAHNPVPTQAENMQPSVAPQPQADKAQQQQQMPNAQPSQQLADGCNGVLLPKGNLVMKLLQVCEPWCISH